MSAQTLTKKDIQDAVYDILRKDSKKQQSVEISTSETNPGPTLTKFVLDHLKYTKIVDDSTMLPKIVFTSKSKCDEKYDSSVKTINEKIKNATTQLETVEDFKERRAIEKTIMTEKNKLSQLKQSGLTEDVIDISKFGFIKDLIKNANITKPEDMIDRIFDGELRGYLDIAHKTSFKDTEELKPLNEAVDRIGFIKHGDKKETIFANKMCEILNDIIKFKIKIFNFVFEHPKDEKGRMVYLLKQYKHMDKVLKWFVEEHDKKKIYKSLLTSELNEFKGLDDYKAKFVFEKSLELMPEWIVELEVEEESKKEVKSKLKNIHTTLRNSMIFYEFLEKYDKEELKEKHKEYTKLCSEYMKLNTEIQTYFSENKEVTIKEIIAKYIYVLQKLRSIDTRSNKVIDSKTNSEKENPNKMDNQFMKELNGLIPHKFNKIVKNKIRACVVSGEQPEFEKEDSEYYFKDSDFESITTLNKDVYNKELYAKFGLICGLKLPKHFRIAVGLRCVSELFKEIKELVTKHNNKQNFTIHVIA